MYYVMLRMVHLYYIAARTVRFKSLAGLTDHWLAVTDQYDITFRVKGCQDAEIYMATYLKSTDFDYYRLVLGADNNHKFILYREEDVVAEVDLGSGGNFNDSFFT